MSRVGLESPLLEREAELERLDQLLGAAAAATGRVALVEGVAGIGKTRLVTAACGRATERGFQVLSARGGELERDLAFGVVRQLFESQIVRASPRRRETLLAGPASVAADALGFELDEDRPAGAPAREADEFSILHGLYWLTANLAERQPVLLAVDDAHWADRPSLRWLAYLVRRLDDMPVMLAVTALVDRPEPQADLLQAIAAEQGASVLRLEPLSSGAVAELVRREYAAEADDDFCLACHEASRGNPFLSRELIAALAQAEVEPTAKRVGRVLEMTPETIARSVLHRLAQLPQPSLELARAVAVLGSRAEPRHAAGLAGLDMQAAESTADLLAAANVLGPGRPLEFVHPVVRSAVYDAIPTGERSHAHASAARLLAADGAFPDRVAVHLLSTDPAGDPWVVEALRAGARAEAGPEQAVTYLRRALAEPPAPEARGDVLLELGEAETLAFEPLEDAIQHLRDALGSTEATAARARAALALSGALIDNGCPDEGLEAIGRAVSELEALEPAVGSEERELLLRCEAMRLTAEDLVGRPLTRSSLARSHELAGEGATPGERVLLANLAYGALMAGASAAEAVALAERALKDDELLQDRLYFDHHVATWALEFADELEAAERHAAAAVAETRRRGSVGELTFALTVRAAITNRRGALRDAEAEVRAALDLADEHGLDPSVVPMTYALLIDVLAEEGKLDDAEEAVAKCGFSPEEPASPVRAFYFHSRGRLRFAQGRLEDALEDLRTAGRMMQERSADHPAFYPWRSSAAVVLLRMDEAPEALRLVEEELDLARSWGAARPLGVALRAAGLVEGGARGIDLLQEAVAVLEGSPAALERARALVELGAALRRGKRRVDSKDPLLRGLDLAHRCGAERLEERAREELAALGARPRRAVLTGVESLTASELRVAKLAAEGLSNREIAQTLFISMPTVEKHLGSTYRKLDIPSRKELPEALQAEAA